MQNRDAHKVFIVRILLLLFCVTAVFSSMMLLHRISRDKKEQAAFEDLSRYVVSQNTTGLDGVQTDVQENAPDAECPNPYAELAQVNPDFVAWLRIPQTKVDYPVMFTPDNPEYYLRRSFDKTDSQNGTLFIGTGATLDSTCFIVYGHNMNSGAMFGTLDRYTDHEFWAGQKTFTLDTINEHREYEVFAVVKTKILAEDTNEFQYYRYAGDLDESQFEELIEGLQDRALYDTHVHPAYGEQIIMLSTCSYHTKNGRLLVAAKEIK